MSQEAALVETPASVLGTTCQHGLLVLCFMTSENPEGPFRNLCFFWDGREALQLCAIPASPMAVPTGSSLKFYDSPCVWKETIQRDALALGVLSSISRAADGLVLAQRWLTYFSGQRHALNQPLEKDGPSAEPGLTGAVSGSAVWVPGTVSPARRSTHVLFPFHLLLLSHVSTGHMTILGFLTLWSNRAGCRTPTFMAPVLGQVVVSGVGALGKST